MVLGRAAVLWVVVAGFATVITFLVFVAFQQHLRSDANHPQVEMVRAAASRLTAGGSPQSVVPATPIDIGTSTDTYLIVVDSNGTVLATSAHLGGSLVVPPSGVFGYVRDHGEDVISWQPAPGVRSAIVVDAFQGGFVVAGRSLRSTEDQEDSLGHWALGVWVAALIATGGLALLVTRQA